MCVYMCVRVWGRRREGVKEGGRGVTGVCMCRYMCLCTCAHVCGV